MRRLAIDTADCPRLPSGSLQLHSAFLTAANSVSVFLHFARVQGYPKPSLEAHLRACRKSPQKLFVRAGMPFWRRECISAITAHLLPIIWGGGRVEITNAACGCTDALAAIARLVAVGKNCRANDKNNFAYAARHLWH